LVMDKISSEDKMWIQTFREIGFGHATVDTNFSEEDLNLSFVKAICLSLFIS